MGFNSGFKGLNNADYSSLCGSTPGVLSVEVARLKQEEATFKQSQWHDLSQIRQMKYIESMST